MALKCCSGCCGSSFQIIKKFFLENFLELKMILWFAGPLAISNLLDYAPYIITTIFCRHLGKLELDGIVLANSIAGVTAQSIGIGLSSACDTLISHIYGGKNLKLIGVVIQRGILILFLACFPCWALFVNTRNILLLCGQDPEVSRLAEQCVIANIPALPGIIWPPVIISLTGNLLNIVLNYVLLVRLEAGVIGTAWAMTVTYTVEMIMIFLYIWLKRLHVETWAGWSTECLKDWWSFLSLGIPNMLMLCMEVWAYEIALFLSGLINLVELGGQSILYLLVVLIYKVSFAIGSAASIRVGTFLGAGDTDQAKKSAKLSFLIIASSILLNVSILLGLRTPIAHIFTTDKDILSIVIQAMPIAVLYYVFDSASCVFSGLLRGIGKPEIGAIAFTFGYLLITFPVGAPLMFVLKLGIRGFWIGITVSFVCIDIFFLIYFWRLNWQDMTDKAQERAGLKLIRRNTPFLCPDSTIDIPDKLELKNYASLDSISSEPELHDGPTEPSKESDPSLKKIIIRRVLESFAVFSVLIIGLIIRFTLKHS
ncbi:multidrug and toxin extrusion protein 1-like isoform 2-T2 [Discoglossus pictus]